MSEMCSFSAFATPAFTLSRETNRTPTATQPFTGWPCNISSSKSRQTGRGGLHLTFFTMASAVRRPRCASGQPKINTPITRNSDIPKDLRILNLSGVSSREKGFVPNTPPATPSTRRGSTCHLLPRTPSQTSFKDRKPPTQMIPSVYSNAPVPFLKHVIRGTLTCQKQVKQHLNAFI